MRHNKITPYLFILPMMLGLVLFRFGPFVASFVISFTRWRGARPPEFIGIRNYVELFQSNTFWEIFGNTFIFAALYVPGVLILGLILALLINQKLKGIAFFRGLFFMPYVTAMVAVAMVWNYIFTSRYGLLNYILRTALNIENPPNWLADSETALLVLVIVSVWKSVGLQMMVFLAGLQGIPKYLYESAQIDGANPWQTFWRITLPLLSPVTFFVLTISIFEAFDTFTVTLVMTQGGPINASSTLPFYVYKNAFEFFRWGFASSIAFVLMTVTIVVTMFNFQIRSRWVHQNVY
jgi:multiple sugar transport system permease protein